jgi:hypothetical protein
MKNLLIFALLVLAAWYGWKKWPEFVDRRPGHDLVLMNETGQALERVRVVVDGQTLVREVIEDGTTVTIPFKVQRESSFLLEAQWSRREGMIQWRGGMVPPGPMLQRHILRIDADGEIMYLTENK